MIQPRPIPNLLNGVIVVAQLCCITLCIACCAREESWPWIAAIVPFAVAMNSVYFVIHEAEHGVLFSNRSLNHFTGTVLSLFMPASYTLLRRVHLAHHIHNRSDDETFDIYFETDPAWWKKLQFFGILTGGFWLTVVVGNLILAVVPARLVVRTLRKDRQSATLTQYMDRDNSWRIRVESWAVIALHAMILIWLGSNAIRYMAMYALFGITWSTLQYVHHYDTCRDVLRGAKNLRYGRLLDLLWLHHGWHLTHHLHPTESWLYLPGIAASDEQPTESLGQAYVRMWRGPVLTTERVANTYEGNVG